MQSPIRTQIDLPEFVQVEITSKCNLKCVMCPLTLGTTQSASEGIHIGELEWDRVVELARKCGKILIVGFGEPSMNPRFLPMLRQLDDLGIKISFSTNGIGAESMMDGFAALHNLVHVNISIDSPDPDIYREIRGVELNRALSGARALAMHLAHRLPVTVAAVVSRKNLHSLMGFPPLLRQIGVRHLLLQGLHAYTSELDQDQITRKQTFSLFRKNDRLDLLMYELKAECERNGIDLIRNERVSVEFFQPRIAAKTYFAEPSNRTGLTRACGIPWVHPYVDAGGRVFPCCHAAGSEPLANVRDSSLEQIWDGPEIRKFRQDLLRPETLPAVCRNCTVVPLGEHPFAQYAAEILSLEPGERFRMKVRNAGTCTWDARNPLRIGTSNPHDRQSVHQAEGWLSHSRPCSMQERSVAPNEVATLTFKLGRGLATRPEAFQLVVEGKHWLPGTLFDCPLPEPPGELSVSELSVSGNGESAALTLHVDDDVAWEADTDANWIRIEPTRGRGPASIALHVAPSPALEPRTAVVRCGSLRCTITQQAIADPLERFAYVGFHALTGHVPPPEARQQTAVEILTSIWQSPAFSDSALKPWQVYCEATGAFPTWTEWNNARQRLLTGSASLDTIVAEWRKQFTGVRSESRVMNETELMWHLTFGAFERRFPRSGEYRSHVGTASCGLEELAEVCLRMPSIRAMLQECGSVTSCGSAN